MKKNSQRLFETLHLYKISIRKELKELLTTGWSDWERKNIWEEYLEKNVKQYPRIYAIFKQKGGLNSSQP